MNINGQPAATRLMIDIKHQPDKVLVHVYIKHQPDTVPVDVGPKIFFIQAKLTKCSQKSVKIVYLFWKLHALKCQENIYLE